MSHNTSNSWSHRMEGHESRHPHDCAPASLSLSADPSMLGHEHTMTYQPAQTHADVSLPRILNPAVANASLSPTNASRSQSGMQPRSSSTGVSYPLAQPSESARAVYAETATPHPHALSPNTKTKQLFSHEETEPNSLFSSRNRGGAGGLTVGGEMSSFGISVSTTTAAGACSVSTMPTRWLRSADVRALGVGSELSPSLSNHNSPHKQPESVFERAVQRRVGQSAFAAEAMLGAAALFIANFD